MTKVELKQPVIAGIVELSNGTQSAAVVDYRDLTVEWDTALHKQLREVSVTYKVYRNTMIRFAAKGTDFEALDSHLGGPTVLAVFRADATVAARIFANLARKADALEIKDGAVEGTCHDAKGMNVIITILSREESLGRLLGSIQSLITNLVRVPNQTAEFKEA